MPRKILRPDCLVLYKQKPARVHQVSSKKISIEIEDSSMLSVRPKDVVILHPGPLADLSSLRPLSGEIETAWEILAGETFDLQTLSELAYGEFTPVTAWVAWEIVADGLYFRGNPEEITTNSPDEVAAEKSAREAKAAEQRAWEAFLERTAAGQIVAEDDVYIQDVIDLANGVRSNSQVLKALGIADTPENAHAWLLKLGVWDYFVNPYPIRAGLALQSSSAAIPKLPNEERYDLSDLPAFAIDDAGSQDPDDALSWDNGRIWVHIADVAAMVEHGSAADLEALARGGNLYLPEGTVLMLPPQSTQMLALGLNEISPALSFGLDTNHEGQVTNLEIVPSWVRVTRLTYEDAERQIDEVPFRQILQVLSRFQARRRQNGAIEIDLPEVKVRLENGAVQITPFLKLRSRELVREAMLMTGEAVSSFAIQHNLPIPFTTQEAPAAEITEAQTPSAMFALRRLLKPSQKSSQPGKHHGLGLENYVQATSPLRRYLDLVAHQQLRAYIRQDQLLTVQEITNLIGASDAVIRELRRVERNSNQHWTCAFLLQHPEWQGEGFVVEQRGRRHVILLPQLDFETSIYHNHDLPLDTVIQLAVNEIDLPHLEASFNIQRSN